MPHLVRIVAFFAIASLLCACGGARSAAPVSLVPAAPVVQHATSPAGIIKHVVIIVEENRSFENMFAGWPKADAPMYGYDHNGERVNLHSMTYANDCYVVSGFSGCDLGHLWHQAIQSWNGGKMNGFDLTGLGTLGSGPPAGTYPYAYMDHTEIAPYRDLAAQYVLADHMFPTEFGTSFTAHQDLIAGTTQVSPGESLVN